MEMNIDSHKLMYHPARVVEWLEKGDCYPIQLEIGPTNACNHKCIFCGLDWITRENIFIDSNVMVRSLEDMADCGVKSVVFAGVGESLLHKDIGLFVKTAKQQGMDVAINTNGIPLTKKRIPQILPYLSWIGFSIDSGSSKNYALIHGTNLDEFERLMQNIEESVKFKRQQDLGVNIGAQFLVLPKNVGEAPKLAKRLKQIGANSLQIKPYAHHKKSFNNLGSDFKEYYPLKQQLMEFDSDDFKIMFRKKTIQRIQEGITYPKCYGLSFFSLINPDGAVTPCNLFYGNNEFTYGNLNKNTFRDIWNGEKRKQVLDRIKTENCSSGCRLHAINSDYLHRLKNPRLNDAFI